MTKGIVPTLRYRDAPEAIEWLGEAFGFSPKAVFDDGEGGIAHAELTLGEGMIMLGSAKDDAFGAIQRPPEAGFVTQSPYIVVEDADALYERAKEAGAEIVLEISDRPYGSREFSCRDPEGHLWNFGTYDPWND